LFDIFVANNHSLRIYEKATGGDIAFLNLAEQFIYPNRHAGSEQYMSRDITTS